MHRRVKLIFNGRRWLWIAAAAAPWLAAALQNAQKVDFAHQIQPILKAKCLSCHSGGSPAANLSLDDPKSLSRLVKAGHPEQSLLVHRITGDDGQPRMPLGFAPLSSEQIALVQSWISQGASLTGTQTAHWAYVPPKRPALPAVKDSSWVRNPIDRFVLARLEREHLRPSPEADKVTLVRRVTLDLIGLPPTPDEVDAFVQDSSPDAYEKLVDRLLASRHYGERMALPWLDAARYADSNGFQMEGDTYQYVWRDWVVKAMNDNMPFDRFTTQQLAGDLLPGVDQSTEQGRSAIVATAFNRNHMLNGEGGAIPEEQRNVYLFDRVDTTATTWLGLTMTCARCHDHKYDPLSQKDFYSLMAYFNDVAESGAPDGGVPYSIAQPWIYAGTQRQVQRVAELNALLPKLRADHARMEASADVKKAEGQWRAGAANKVPDPAIRKALETKAGDAQESRAAASRLHEYFLDHELPAAASIIRKRLKDAETELARLKAAMPRVMVMNERRPRETHIYNRGNYEEPRDKVSPGIPAIFGAGGPGKDRLGLARWIVDPANPLTARVQVNRFWQLFFGQGLVRTPENFGVQGERPTHPELLDWLAVEFRESGWDVKRLHRLIVTSATYRQTSRVTPQLLKRDPDNRLLARGVRMRLPSMLLRDQALAASGLLDRRIGGKPVYPYQPPGIWDGLAITDERDFSYPQSHGGDLYRRSLYTFWRRTVAPGNMFDSASRQVCTVRQSRTSTPLHALTTFNDITWVEAARALAQRVMQHHATAEARLVEAFRRVCARVPDKAEMKILERALGHAHQDFTEHPDAAEQFLSQGESKRDRRIDPVEHAAYASVCLAIFNLDEGLTRE